MEGISLTLDISLVFAAILVYRTRLRVGDQLAKGLRTIMIGIMLLGFAHLIEILLFTLFNLDTELNEMIERLLIGSSFVCIYIGLRTINRIFM